MIPIQTLTEFPVFGNAACKVEPPQEKYAAGFLPADVLPAQWENWFLNKSSTAITNLNTGVAAVETELNCLITCAGLQVESCQCSQVYDAVNCMTTTATARSLQIKDSTNAHCGNAVDFRSGTALVLNLPSTITASLNGNADTATLATCAQKDGAGCSFGTAARYNYGDFRPSSWTPDTVDKANRLNLVSGTSSTWRWEGNYTNPAWLWGGNNSDTMCVYSPNCLCVKYAESAGSVSGETITLTCANPTGTLGGVTYRLQKSGELSWALTSIIINVCSSDQNAKPFIMQVKAKCVGTDTLYAQIYDCATCGYSKPVLMSYDANSCGLWGAQTVNICNSCQYIPLALLGNALNKVCTGTGTTIWNFYNGGSWPFNCKQCTQNAIAVFYRNAAANTYFSNLQVTIKQL